MSVPNFTDAIMSLFYKLVELRSDTETRREKDIEHYMLNWVGHQTYFQRNPSHFGAEPLADDPLHRSIVWALVKGKGAQTVVLVNHHDTVHANSFGALAPFAHHPEKLIAKLSEMKLPPEMARDLRSGDWIFGRGTADMKAGVALQMALTAEYSSRQDLVGNLLCLSVPGEEYMSLGMLNSVPLMERLAENFGLDYHLLIDSETHQRGEDQQGVLYEGSAGKLLALVYVRGRAAHVGNVFAGFNPLMLLSEIVKQTELNTDFSDVVANEVAPPPTWMFLRDRQTVYEGSIPHAAAGCLSLISLNRRPAAILIQLIQTIEKACSHVVRTIKDRQKIYTSLGVGTEQLTSWTVQIRTFSEIFTAATRESGQRFLNDYNKTFEQIDRLICNGQTGIQEGSYRLIEKVFEYLADRSPSVVLAFLPPYYPHAANRDYPSLPSSVASLSKAINSFTTQRWDESYKKLNYYMQISDMSFASFHDCSEAVSAIGSNMPFWDKYYGNVFHENINLSMPVINIGPWGKDLHKFGERVYKPDLAQRTYPILKYAVSHILSRPNSAGNE